MLLSSRINCISDKQDSDVHIENQPHNILIVKKFQGQAKDKELKKLTPFLKFLAKVPDVRSVSENFARFRKEAKALVDTSILTKGLGDKTPKAKLLQALNTQFKQKPRSPKKVIDKSNFENTDEGVVQWNLTQRMISRSQKRLIFDQMRSQSPKKVAKFETVECLEYNVVLEDDFMEADLQPAQEYESLPNTTFPQ